MSLLVYDAARLARTIRRESPNRIKYNYPPRMELATTCCNHVVIDDGNHEDATVASCIQYAARQEHPACLRLALMLARASMTQRRRITYLSWWWVPPEMEPWR